MFICLLLTTFTAPFAMGQNGDDAAKIRAQVIKYDNGKKKRVKVELRSGSTLKGCISRAGADSFELTDSKSGKASTLANRDIASIRKSGGLSTGSIIGIAAGVAAAVAVLSIVGAYCRNEGYLGF